MKFFFKKVQFQPFSMIHFLMVRNALDQWERYFWGADKGTIVLLNWITGLLLVPSKAQVNPALTRAPSLVDPSKNQSDSLMISDVMYE